MPILIRQPERPQVVGLLIVLAVILLVAVVRYFPFFLHEVWGLR